MQNSVNHAPGLKCKVCPRLLKEVIEQLGTKLAHQTRIDSLFSRADGTAGSLVGLEGRPGFLNRLLAAAPRLTDAQRRR